MLLELASHRLPRTHVGSPISAPTKVRFCALWGRLLFQAASTLCRNQTLEALRNADASLVDQPGHVVNVCVRGVSGTVAVDGQDAVSFAESANVIYVRFCLSTKGTDLPN